MTFMDGRDPMAQKNFTVDGNTLELLEELREELKLSSDAAVFRRALALMKLAVDHSRSSGYVVKMRGKNEPEDEADNYMLQG